MLNSCFVLGVGTVLKSWNRFFGGWTRVPAMHRVPVGIGATRNYPVPINRGSTGTREYPRVLDSGSRRMEPGLTRSEPSTRDAPSTREVPSTRRNRLHRLYRYLPSTGYP